MDLDIRGLKCELGEDLSEHIVRRLRFALGRFSARIERVVVRLSDVNGPRGGIDERCRIAVALIPRGVVRVEGSGHEPFALAAHAAKRASRAVRRALGRHRRVCPA